ncbi:MAG: IS3 family transposase [Saccharofermentans sp.]|nr:IS3 family transposase [Saccharofermentans sp.]
MKYVKIIERIFEENRRNCGYRAVKRRLEQEGYYLSEYMVRKIMKQNGLYPETMKKYKSCHNGKKDGKYLNNRVKQQFNADEWKNHYTKSTALQFLQQR